jgi:hypothetical protein
MATYKIDSKIILNNTIKETIIPLLNKLTSTSISIHISSINNIIDYINSNLNYISIQYKDLNINHLITSFNSIKYHYNDTLIHILNNKNVQLNTANSPNHMLNIIISQESDK